MSASENGQRQEVKEMKPISADGEYAKDLKTVYQGKAKNKRRMRRGGGDGNELMTEIESERRRRRRGDRHSLLPRAAGLVSSHCPRWLD